MGPRLPLVETGCASIFSIIGIRKLSVLPVPVEAVARMSAPSSAGGIAPAWTGVGVVKLAAARRCLSESEMLKSAEVDCLGVFIGDAAGREREERDSGSIRA